MKLLFFLVGLTFVSAISRVRSLGGTLSPAAFVSVYDSYSGCIISCSDWDTDAASCQPPPSSELVSCSSCDTAGCPAGACKVPGTKSRICTSPNATDACQAQVLDHSSTLCTATITCFDCGVVTVNIEAANFSCSYDTCKGESACPPYEPQPECAVSEWSGWSQCMIPQTNQPVTCFYQVGMTPGQQVRSRNINVLDNCLMPADNVLVQTRDCYINRDLCKKDCNQTAWTVISPCPSCWNRYTQKDPPVSWSQSIVYYSPAYPYWGQACQTSGAMKQGNAYLKSQTCNIPACARDCVMNQWSPWSPCDKNCTDYSIPCTNCVGQQSRSRTIAVQPEFGGLACPSLSQSQTCNDVPCPIPCLMSEWSSWTQCSAKCGGGQQQRQRQAIRAAQYGGTACGNSLEFRPCNSESCPVGCVVGNWSTWSPPTCPTCVPEGTFAPVRTRSRVVLSGPQNGGYDCPALTDQDSCPNIYCPQNCTMTDWEAWTPCSASCGTGKRYRSRSVLRPSSYGGSDADCQVFYQEQTCSTTACPQPCVYVWGPWHSPNDTNLECSQPCAVPGQPAGTQVRYPNILIPASYGGIACPLPQTRECGTKCCPVDCGVSEWSFSTSACFDTNWNTTQCGAKCGLGWCHRTRTITRAPRCGGSGCPLLDDWMSCKIANCTQPCRYSEWSGWSTCPQCVPEPAGELVFDYSRTRTRHVLNHPDTTPDGECGVLSQTESCNVRYCPVSCEYGEWTTGACSVSCGYGIQQRTRIITQHPKYGGTPCPHINEYVPCKMQDCEHQCVVSDWNQWGPCPATCSRANETYYKVRTREILLNGTNCPVQLTDSKPCAVSECPQNCRLSEWGSWTTCEGCGLQQRNRTRGILVHAANGGRPCESTVEYGLCQLPACIKPCEFSPWSDWGPCSASCGAGSQSRHRYLLDYDSEPDLCPTRLQSRQCQELACCPVDCQFYYSDWSQCSFEGYRRRSVIVKIPASCNGAPCPKCTVERDDCTPPERSDVCWLEHCEEPATS